MTSNRFVYSPDIEIKVKEAAPRILNTDVIQIKKIEGGEFNYVYAVETETKKVVIRVFSHPTFPTVEKLEWINKQLQTNNIPHAELLFYTRNADIFPYGFMISEFIEGQNPMNLMKSGQLSLAEFHENLGVLLNKVHTITLGKYGNIENGDGTEETLLDYYLTEAKKALSYESVVDIFKVNLFPIVEKKVNNLLVPLVKTFEPVLVHKDATPDNCILKSNGELVLVDWDSAISSLWVADYAIITYSGSHLSKFGPLEQRQKIIRETLLKGYGPMIYTTEELENIEKAFHIFRACELLPYYASFQENLSAFEITKEKLNVLLDIN